MKLTCGHKAIAAVVALATDHADGVELKMFLRELGDGAPGVLHQGKRRYAMLLSGGAINSAHLFRGNDFHDRVAAARVSSFASWGVSPMAMRWSLPWIGSGASGLKRVLPSAWRMARIMMPNLW